MHAKDERFFPLSYGLKGMAKVKVFFLPQTVNNRQAKN